MTKKKIREIGLMQDINPMTEKSRKVPQHDVYIKPTFILFHRHFQFGGLIVAAKCLALGGMEL